MSRWRASKSTFKRSTWWADQVYLDFLLRLAQLPELANREQSSGGSSKFKKSAAVQADFSMLRAKYPAALGFLECRERYVKHFFQKFYSVAGHEMFKVVKEHGKLGELLCSRAVSFQMLKKYLQMNQLEQLYCHFFKKSAMQNDAEIHAKLVG